MKHKFTRREFLTVAGKAGALVALAGCSVGNEGAKMAAGRKSSKATDSTIAVASEGSPEALVVASVAALGGMSAFVKAGDRVVLKPNASWARRPEDAATTNPAVVAAVVKLCKKAGASEVLVVDHVIDRPTELVFQITGIRGACESSGAKAVSAGSKSMYRRISIPDCEILSDEQVIKEVLDADVFINIPVAKVHSDTDVSLGMKNLMGVIWARQPWHSSPNVHQCIAEFGRAVRADLTILDANRALLTNGPKGPGKTADFGQVIAGRDPVAVDAYGATLFGLKPEDVEHIHLAHTYGLGESDMGKIKILKV